MWRREAPHVLGALLRRHGDLADCEDAVQEALVAASQQWPVEGVPDSPRGWLVRVASRRLVDRVRSDRARRDREEADAVARPADADVVAGADVPEQDGGADDGLLLLLLCCHPSLTRASQVALTLRAVAGLSTAQVASAFLVPEATMAQRVSRAKATLRADGARFVLPSPSELPARVAAVLDVLHLVFTEGHTASSGEALVDVSLSDEAIRLTRQLAAALPEHDEVAGALALMLLTSARAATRVDEHGDLVTLADQDRSRWDAAALAEGVAILERVLPRGPVGRYQLQAAIAAVHAEAPTWRGDRLGAGDRALPDARRGRSGARRHAQPRGRRRDVRRAAGRPRAARAAGRHTVPAPAPPPVCRARAPARDGRRPAGCRVGVRTGRRAHGQHPRAALPQPAGGCGAGAGVGLRCGVRSGVGGQSSPSWRGRSSTWGPTSQARRVTGSQRRSVVAVPTMASAGVPWAVCRAWSAAAAWSAVSPRARVTCGRPPAGLHEVRLVREPGPRLGGGGVQVEQLAGGDDEAREDEPALPEDEQPAQPQREREPHREVDERRLRSRGGPAGEGDGDVRGVGRAAVVLLAREAGLRQCRPLGAHRGVGDRVEEELEGLHRVRPGHDEAAACPEGLGCGRSGAQDGRGQRGAQAAARRWTLPRLRHEVQTLSRTGVPSTVARTFWMLGLNRREDLPLIRRLTALRPKRETVLPKDGFLSQI